ncbi:MAG TPA: hypothetical protein PK122_01130 [Candidatus Paceibacterota bacterium]|nr:hypothetical protein [Candidatus Paceibacterota bacterium]
MLVRESVNFIRGDRDEESVKTSLFGIRVGHIVIPSKLPPFPNSRSGVTMPAYLVESIHDEGRKRSLRLLGIGYFYNLNFRNPGDTPSRWFSFSSGFSSSLGDEEDYKPIDSILKEMILDSLKKEPERRTWEVHKMNFYDRSGGKPILLKEELFHRSSTKSQIKDKLIGFRPGSIITSTEPWPANKPYKEVYMYIKKGEKFNDQGNPIIVTYIGALSKRDGKLSQFLIRHKKMLGETVIWEENKRSLTPEELQKVQKTFSEIPSYHQKIYDETGIKPSLNESLNFERGLDPKHSMKIGKRGLIIKWFSDLGIDESRYEILPDLSIKVNGNLDLSNTPITSLPDNLTIGGDLYLRNTQITSLPDNLTVGRWLDLNNTPITSLPDNLSVGGSLYLSNTSITSLPDNLTVGGNLDLNNTPITSLPDNLTVEGWLDLSNTPITSLPDNLTVEGWLDLNNTPITSLPDNLTVEGNLDLSNTQITSLPDNLTVEGNLDLSNTPITSLPDNLTVEGNLDLNNTQITSLPPSLKVKGEIIGFKERIVKESLEFHRTYSEAEIKEKLFGWRSGQILIYNTERKHGVTKLFVYNETLESDDVLKPWNIQCMEIGHMGGNPKYAYIHVGFFPSLTIKREKDLRIPNLEEREVIKKALKKEYYKKEIKKIEEKLGVRIFV